MHGDRQEHKRRERRSQSRPIKDGRSLNQRRVIGGGKDDIQKEKRYEGVSREG